MVATVNVQEGNGSGPTWSNITNGRYCLTDSKDPGTSFPCIVPVSGVARSFWKSHRLSWSGVGTQLSNIKWFGPGGTIKNTWELGTGGGVVVAKKATGPHGCDTYQQATGTETTGHDIMDSTNGHACYKTSGSVVSIDTYTSANPLDVDNTVYGSGSGFSKHVVTQVVIGYDAVQGDKTNITFTFQYDEI